MKDPVIGVPSRCHGEGRARGADTTLALKGVRPHGERACREWSGVNRSDGLERLAVEAAGAQVVGVADAGGVAITQRQVDSRDQAKNPRSKGQ